MKVDQKEIEVYAERKGFSLDSDRPFLGFYDLEGCLPASEQDALFEGVYENDAAFDATCRKYFLDWDADYINGFCTSIRNKVIIGRYMAERNVHDLLIER